jgi:hypothetical protein
MIPTFCDGEHVHVLKSFAYVNHDLFVDTLCGKRLKNPVSGLEIDFFSGFDCDTCGEALQKIQVPQLFGPLVAGFSPSW